MGRVGHAREGSGFIRRLLVDGRWRMNPFLETFTVRLQMHGASVPVGSGFGWVLVPG